MMKKHIAFILFLFVASSVYAQKTTYSNNINLIKAIIPDTKINSWVLIYNEYGRDKIIKQVGEKLSYMPQFSGFRLDNDQDHYFYIAYSEAGKISYINSLDGLQNFAGNISNGEEAALSAIFNGYFIDFEFKEYAANYENAGANYLVEAAKITSEKCPVAKNHYLLTIDKKTGTIVSEKDLGKYNELYTKDCKNNPQYDVVKQQMEEARLKAEEQKKIQQQMTEKMKKRLEKNRRKD